MQQTCERAVRIGLPAVVFTEHLDLDDAWRADPSDFPPANHPLISDDGYLRPPPLDVEGYLESIQRCQHRFPDLRILTGVEFGQPHLFQDQARRLLDMASLDRVNGSLHTLAHGSDRAEPVTLFRLWPPDQVMWAYLDEVPQMVAGSEVFEVFCHLDYAVRHWPALEAGPFDPTRFEEGFRAALRAIAGSGRVLEMNTRRLRPWLPQWWRDEGGRAVSFGSDAHGPGALADGLPEAASMLEYLGFKPGRAPQDFWTR